MTVWEIVIIMVVGCICITGGIGVVYQSIVNTVERYQIRRAKRSLEIYTKVIEQMPTLINNLIGMVEEQTKKDEKKRKELIDRMNKMV